MDNNLDNGGVSVIRQTDEINIFFNLSKSLTEVLDLTEVLNRVVEAARYLTEAEEGMILLPEGDELYLRARVGIDIESARNFRIKVKDNLAGSVLSSGKGVLIGAKGPQKIKTEYLANSLLYVPMLLQGRVVGVLGVANRERVALFTEHHLQLLVNLAAYAVIAIENARIHQESLERSRQLEMLVNAGEVLNASLPLKKTLPDICKQLATVVGADYAEILKWDERNHVLTSLACFHNMVWDIGKGPLLHHTAKTPLANDEYLLLTASDIEDIEDVDYLQSLGAQAMLIFPIASGKQLLGCVRAFYVQSLVDFPTDKVIKQVRYTGLSALIDVLDHPARDVSANMSRLLAEIRLLLGADWCELALPKDSTQELSLLARVGSGVWFDLQNAPRIDLNECLELTQELSNASVIKAQSGEIRTAACARPLLARAQGDSVLGVPLIQRGQSQGIVIFAFSQPDHVFTSRDVNMARAIVGQAAIALENASLVHDLEQSLDELKNAQSRLVQTARLSAMGELAAIVAHQINNPLTTIIADTELLLLDKTEDASNYESLMAISRAGKRAANVARRLLAVAKPVEINASRQLINVVDSLLGILSLLRAHIERDDVRIIIKIPDDALPPVKAVKGQLDDIWINLLMNASDALRDRTKGEIGVEVNCLPDNSSIEVIIWDDGPGIPDDIIRQIFSPFFTTKPVGEGAGLGLHICREVIGNIGGQIECESVPDRMTRFIVTLPIFRHDRE